MIRRISLVLLLANTTVAVAQPLYKWTESDGSITFSPKRPAAGVSYETVHGDTDPQISASPASQTNSASQTATNTPQITSAPLPRIEYAPGDRNDVREAITQSAAATANTGGSPVQSVETAIAVGHRTSGQDDVVHQSQQASAARNKQSRCQDLHKRVVSLERRLKSRLTPEDMDNTVVHMARYQRSFDQYCAQ